MEGNTTSKQILIGAGAVFLGLLFFIIFLFVISLILYLIYENKYFSKEKQKKYKDEIKEYLKK